MIIKGKRTLIIRKITPIEIGMTWNRNDNLYSIKLQHLYRQLVFDIGLPIRPVCYI